MTPYGDRKSPGFYRRRGKRVFDVLASVVACALLAPIFVGIAVLIRCCVGSPVIFRQQRSGLDKRVFTILKFRTMTNECDASGELLSDSRRLTPLGRFLRHTS